MAWNPWYPLVTPVSGSNVGRGRSGTASNWNALTNAAVKRKKLFRANGSPKHCRLPAQPFKKNDKYILSSAIIVRSIIYLSRMALNVPISSIEYHRNLNAFQVWRLADRSSKFRPCWQNRDWSATDLSVQRVIHIINNEKKRNRVCIFRGRIVILK
jgi:hypothetical protein